MAKSKRKRSAAARNKREEKQLVRIALIVTVIGLFLAFLYFRS